MENSDCNNALIRIFPKINLEDIKDLFDSIPLEYNNLPVLTDLQRKLYYKSLEYKYENVFKIIYQKLIDMR